MWKLEVVVGDSTTTSLHLSYKRSLDFLRLMLAAGDYPVELIPPDTLVDYASKIGWQVTLKYVDRDDLS